MPHKPLYFPIVRSFFSTHLAEGQQLEPSFLALHWLQLSVDWNNIRELCLLLISCNISTISPSPSLGGEQHSSYLEHEISLIVLSLLSPRLQQQQFPLTLSSSAQQVQSGLDVVGRDWRHNHQSVSTNAAFSLVLSPRPTYRPIHSQ